MNVLAQFSIALHCDEFDCYRSAAAIYLFYFYFKVKLGVIGVGAVECIVRCCWIVCEERSAKLRYLSFKLSHCKPLICISDCTERKKLKP